MKTTPLVIVAVLASARIAGAQGTATAQAEQLFRDGKQLMSERKFAEACAAFEASQKIEANIVTKLRIADCREQNGQLATAWGLFLQVESDTRKDPSLEAFHKKANQRAAAIEPRLSYLIINVPDGSRTGGLAITRDGVVIDEVMWNRALPIDGGEHVVEAKARGREPWTAKVTVRAEGDKQSVDVPRFEDVAAAVPASGGGATVQVPSPSRPATVREVAPEGGERRRGGRGLAVAIGIGGVLAVTSAVIFETKSQGNYEESTREPDDDEQLDLYRSANRDHKLAQGAAIGGAALLVTSAVLWWRGGKPAPIAVAPASGGGASVVVGGRF